MFKNITTASLTAYAVLVVVLASCLQGAMLMQDGYEYDKHDDTCLVDMTGSITEVNDRFIKCMIERDDTLNK